MALNAKQGIILDRFIEDCTHNTVEGFRYMNPWTHQPMDIVNAEDLHDDHWKLLNDADDITEVFWEVTMKVRYSDVTRYLRVISAK